VQTCEQCGFSYEALAVGEIARRLRSGPSRYRSALSGASPDTARRRPEPDVWSAHEYVCHVRDVLLVQRDRAVLAQVEEQPSCARMHRDERVDLCGYADQALDEVLAQLEMAAELCALVFDRLDDAAWQRRLIYNWPAAADRDLAWLGRHTVHEVEHHLQDVAAVLRQHGLWYSS
jgi:DNA segregation ATPase FtsK/SpoIIIE, S-DNA-T family